MKKIWETIKNFNPTMTFLIAMPSTFVIAAVLLVLGWQLSPADRTLTWIICATAYLLGMPLGMLSSPHKGEASNFQFLGAHVATLVSGYVLAKLTSPSVGIWFSAAVANPLPGGRLMLFISFFVLGLVQTFVVRYYSDKDREQDRFAAKAKTQEPSTKP